MLCLYTTSCLCYKTIYGLHQPIQVSVWYRMEIEGDTSCNTFLWLSNKAKSVTGRSMCVCAIIFYKKIIVFPKFVYMALLASYIYSIRKKSRVLLCIYTGFSKKSVHQSVDNYISALFEESEMVQIYYCEYIERELFNGVCLPDNFQDFIATWDKIYGRNFIGIICQDEIVTEY